MASYGKINSKKIPLLKEISNPSFPISPKDPEFLNYYAAIKLNIKKNYKKHSKNNDSNNLNSKFQYKKMIENSPAINNSKIKPLDFSDNINDNKLLEKYRKNNNNQKRQNLSAHKKNIYLQMYSSRDNINNLNIISPKNIIGNDQLVNINKNYLNNLRNHNLNKNILNSNNSYSNNINIINNKSSSNINKIPKLISQKSTFNESNLKMDINNIDINSRKESKIKLIFNNKNHVTKLKTDNQDTPIILKKKDSSLPSTNNNPGSDLKNYNDNNNISGGYKLHLKKQNIDASNKSNIIDMNINDIVNKNEPKKKKKVKGPEDLHFYYILVIQEGKKKEKQFEKD